MTTDARKEGGKFLLPDKSHWLDQSLNQFPFQSDQSEGCASMTHTLLIEQVRSPFLIPLRNLVNLLHCREGGWHMNNYER